MHVDGHAVARPVYLHLNHHRPGSWPAPPAAVPPRHRRPLMKLCISATVAAGNALPRARSYVFSRARAPLRPRRVSSAVGSVLSVGMVSPSVSVSSVGLKSNCGPDSTVPVSFGSSVPERSPGTVASLTCVDRSGLPPPYGGRLLGTVNGNGRVTHLHRPFRPFRGYRGRGTGTVAGHGPQLSATGTVRRDHIPI